MIFDKILGKLGYIEKSEYDKLEELLEKWVRTCGTEKIEKENAIETRDNVLKINKDLEKENDELREREAELKAALCDETQKRFKMREAVIELESWKNECNFIWERYLGAMHENEDLKKRLRKVIEEPETKQEG